MRIVALLRQFELLIAQGTLEAKALRILGITRSTYWRWRNDYGGVEIDSGKLLGLLEKQNAELRQCVSDLALQTAALRQRLKPSA
jgi:hypothetical protein